MASILDTIIAKSDQLNADDLIGAPRTIRVSEVRFTGAEQPVAIHYEGDAGKPFMACKSMRRVLVNVWGPDANAYVGRSMTLYRDPTVKWGGQAVGGIRISHMSHIDREVTMALTETRANRKPFTVKPLKDAPASGQGRPPAASERSDGPTQPETSYAAPGLPGRVDQACAALGRCKDRAAIDTVWVKTAGLRDDIGDDAVLQRRLSDAHTAAVEAISEASGETEY